MHNMVSIIKLKRTYCLTLIFTTFTKMYALCWESNPPPPIPALHPDLCQCRFNESHDKDIKIIWWLTNFTFGSPALVITITAIFKSKRHFDKYFI